MTPFAANPEKERLAQDNQEKTHPWKQWGPYLSERQWGTVREDYSADANPWRYFTHDNACSRAYRWGEDGIAGFSDANQLLCMGLALWNGRDPLLKERLFGLGNQEGNHGEDVKEIYYYLDATPSHSYLSMLYKYPQRAFPYEQLIEGNRLRDRTEGEFELIDTGIFGDDRYFDVFIEYAKAAPEDICMRVRVVNRGPEAAALHLLPHLWFRNTWSWDGAAVKPSLVKRDDNEISAEHPLLGLMHWYAQEGGEILFCENETNTARLFHGGPHAGPFKDAFHEYVVRGNRNALGDGARGTKACARYELNLASCHTIEINVRLSRNQLIAPFEAFSAIFDTRKSEADAFYDELQRGIDDADQRLVQRQAFAGMIWSKQFYYFDVPQWLSGDPGLPAPPPPRRKGRNSEWFHLNNADVLSMPDKWEFPWYAAWDLAFHCITLALIDAEFAKSQLILLTREWYMHPSGQLPAYEWDFSDANPPLHAWAAWRVYRIDAARSGRPDRQFLERVFHKLLINFTWWVNRKDPEGLNVFQGGFLGLDNIGVFDRSRPLPSGGSITQADATSWMAMYSLTMMRIALELARANHVYEDIATKFFEHFLYIAYAMTNIGGRGVGLWDEQDEFFYNMLHLPDGSIVALKVRSLVGLIPLFAVETIEPCLLTELPDFKRRLEWFLNYRPDLASLVSHWTIGGSCERRLLSLLRGHRMKCLLRRMLDPGEFLSDYGVRALSRCHRDHPYRFTTDNGEVLEVDYEPAESRSGIFGGNSNWRGPIWMPFNYLLIESLQKFHHYYGDDFKIECPTGSGNFTTILGVAEELTRRLTGMFLRRGPLGRPIFGGNEKMRADPNFRDYLLFNEYFHGDNGRGLGASHQTGWTGLIAKLLMPRRQP